MSEPMRNALLLASLLLTAGANAQTKTFKVGAFDARQIATVESDTDFETFTGRTHKVTGQFQFDPSKRTGSGYLAVDLNTVDTGIAARDEHMRSPQWLDTAKFPQTKFEASKVRHLGGDNYEITGKLTLHGVTRDIRTRARVRYLAASDLTRSKGFKGDILHVQGKVNVKLADYGVNMPAIAKGKVAETVTLTVSAFGTTA